MAEEDKFDQNKGLWHQPTNPPSPMFFNDKERDFVKQVNDELIERVIGQQVLYYPISVEHSDFHPLYGEAIKKSFLPPIRVYALVTWEGLQDNYMPNIGIDKITSIVVNFHKRRLTEDQDLFVRTGDYVLYGTAYYQIVRIGEPRQLFGNIGHRFEISAKCVRARQGLFDGE